MDDDFGMLVDRPRVRQAEPVAKVDPQVAAFLHDNNSVIANEIGVNTWNGPPSSNRSAEAFSVDANQSVSGRTSPGVFDLEVMAVRHCRFPCDLPWHNHE